MLKTLGFRYCALLFSPYLCTQNHRYKIAGCDGQPSIVRDIMLLTKSHSLPDSGNRLPIWLLCLFVGNHIDSCHPACFVIHQWLELVVDGSFHHPFYRLNGISMLYGQTLRCLFIQRRWLEIKIYVKIFVFICKKS